MIWGEVNNKVKCSKITVHNTKHITTPSVKNILKIRKTTVHLATTSKTIALRTGRRGWTDWRG